MKINLSCTRREETYRATVVQLLTDLLHSIQYLWPVFALAYSSLMAIHGHYLWRQYRVAISCGKPRAVQSNVRVAVSSGRSSTLESSLELLEMHTSIFKQKKSHVQGPLGTVRNALQTALSGVVAPLLHAE